MKTSDEHTNGTTPLALPQGTYAGTTAQARAHLTAEGMRRTADELAGRMTDPGGGGFDPSAGFKEATHPGDTPSAVFSRTRIETWEDVKFYACHYALQMEALKDDPLWRDEPWLKTDDPAAAYLYLENVFAMSLDGLSRKEGVLSSVGMIMDVWTRDAYDENGFLRRRKR